MRDISPVIRLMADSRPALHSETYAVGAQAAGSWGGVLSFKLNEKSRALPPVFDRVSVCGSRLFLNIVVENWGGLAPITGGRRPEPRSAIEATGVSGSLLAMSTVPVNEAGSAGAKVTVSAAVDCAGMLRAETEGTNSLRSVVIDWILSVSVPRLWMATVSDRRTPMKFGPKSRRSLAPV